MLTEQEATGAYADLRRIIAEAGLEWVVEQVEYTLKAGLVELQKKETYHEDLSTVETEQTVPRVKKGPHAQLLVLRSAGNRDALRMLILALRRAVIDTAAMSTRAMEAFKSVPPSNQQLVAQRQTPTLFGRSEILVSAAESVEFVSEATEETLNLIEDAKRADAAARLGELLDELEREV